MNLVLKNQPAPLAAALQQPGGCTYLGTVGSPCSLTPSSIPAPLSPFSLRLLPQTLSFLQVFIFAQLHFLPPAFEPPDHFNKFVASAFSLLNAGCFVCIFSPTTFEEAHEPLTLTG